jgi:sugar-specific transcriptional regulator TrmB
MTRIDLTGFGFTPTESVVYDALLRTGAGSGYAIARAAGLARANAYSALEGLVTKGAARVESGRPRRYRPEAPSALIARISNAHGQALERLSAALDDVSAPEAPSIVEIDSARSVLQLLSHHVARASRSVELLAPPDAYPLLAPALRRPVSAGLLVALWSTGPVQLDIAPVGIATGQAAWPGMPIIAAIDESSAIIGARNGNEVQGHWSNAPTFIAAARLALARFTSES